MAVKLTKQRRPAARPAKSAKPVREVDAKSTASISDHSDSYPSGSQSDSSSTSKSKSSSKLFSNIGTAVLGDSRIKADVMAITDTTVRDPSDQELEKIAHYANSCRAEFWVVIRTLKSRLGTGFTRVSRRDWIPTFKAFKVLDYLLHHSPRAFEWGARFMETDYNFYAQYYDWKLDDERGKWLVITAAERVINVLRSLDYFDYAGLKAKLPKQKGVLRDLSVRSSAPSSASDMAMAHDLNQLAPLGKHTYMARAKYAHQAEPHSQELSFRNGDVVYIYESDIMDKSRWLARKKDGSNAGYVPSNFFTDMTANPRRAVSAVQSGFAIQVRAVATYRAQEGDEGCLSLAKDEILFVGAGGPDKNGWIRAIKMDGDVGWVPDGWLDRI